jgi:hypothetical protein
MRQDADLRGLLKGPGSFPGIIFYMDAPGIRKELRNMGAADRQAWLFLPYRLAPAASMFRAATIG